MTAPVSEADKAAYLARTRERQRQSAATSERDRLVAVKHGAWEHFRRAVLEGRPEEIGPAWARLCRLHRRLVSLTPPERVVG